MKFNWSIFVVLILLAESLSAQMYNVPKAKTKRWQKAQKFKPSFRYWTVGGYVGVATYHGDLNPRNNYANGHWTGVRPSLGVDLTWRYSPRFSFRGSLAYSRLHGEDSKTNIDFTNANIEMDSEGARFGRNASFHNNIIELKADVIIDLFENRRNLWSKVKWTPYMALGLGLIYSNPMGRYGGESYNLRKLGTEGQLLNGGKPYSPLQFVIPISVGVRYKLNTSMDIALEIGARMTFTDFLDDVSGNYADKEKLGNPDDIAVLLSDRSVELTDEQLSYLGYERYNVNGYDYTSVSYSFLPGQEVPRGNINDKDWYVVTAFHFTYVFHPRTYAARYKG